MIVDNAFQKQTFSLNFYKILPQDGHVSMIYQLRELAFSTGLLFSSKLLSDMRHYTFALKNGKLETHDRCLVWTSSCRTH